ncbi:MAG TPA: S8 family serine peptidase [Mycobacteriales bacterium]|nr:S8 family serine peptidase [Mycobacteriales bacterium]
MPTRGLTRALRAAGLAAAVALAVPSLAVPASAGATDVTYVVTFAAPPTATDVEVLRGVASAVHPYRAVPAAAVVLPGALVPLLRNLPGVRGVWPNERYQLLDLAADQSIRADTAWGRYSGGLGYTGTGWTGAGIGIGVVDAGVDGTHPDLCGAAAFCKGTPVKTVQNVKFVGDTDRADPVVPVENVISTDTTSGHGSHVAGIAAGYGTASSVPGLYQGVAPGAQLVGLGTGEAVEVINVLAGFDYTLAHREQYNIKVLNNSWGPGAGTPYDPEHPVNRAIDAAWDAGISVVFGAGNDGPRTDALNAFSVNPHAISVAATNKRTGHIGFFSSRGVPGSPFWHPTVGAPGENIVSVRSLTGATTHAGDATSANPEPIAPEDTPYYGNVNGTSMASPHVAGVVALMQQASFVSRGAYLTPQQVKDIVQGSAQRGGAPGLPNYQQYSMGAGLVDADRATRMAAAGTAPAYDDGVTYDVRAFAGTVGPAAFVQTSAFESAVEVAPGALSLDVMVDWKTAYADDVDITVYDPSGTNRGSTQLLCGAPQPNGYSSFCSSAPNERLTFVAPEPGRWRVAVGGFVNTTEDVRGLWSVAYPDGTAGVAPPAAPATIALAAATPASVQGQPDALTATVRDASGTVVPNAAVTWTSTGAGGVRNAETVTAGDGVAGANALSDAPGTQTVTATAGGVSASVTLTWVGLSVPCLACGTTASSTPGRASGGGWFVVGAGPKRAFGVEAEYNAGAAMPGGSLSYDDRSGTVVSARVVDTLRVDGTTAVLTGPATVNGAAGYRYQVTVTDNGEPGRADTFRIVLSKAGDALWSYSAAGALGGGNVQVRAG